jgi:hypothetical protein
VFVRLHFVSIYSHKTDYLLYVYTIFMKCTDCTTNITGHSATVRIGVLSQHAVLLVTPASLATLTIHRYLTTYIHVLICIYMQAYLQTSAHLGRGELPIAHCCVCTCCSANGHIFSRAVARTLTFTTSVCLYTYTINTTQL